MNAVEIEEAISVLAEQPFDAPDFPFAFLEAFGNKQTTLKRLRSGSSNKSDLGGVLQTNNIHIAVCAEGDITKTLTSLKASPATAKAKAKFVLATDGIYLEAEDLNSGEVIASTYTDFPNHFGFFLPLAGITTVKQIRESSFDIRATSRLNRLYVELLKDNPEWGTEARSHDMNHFMARLIFCFFAEDTDIFTGEDAFTGTIERMSERDSSNTHKVISALFLSMNTKPKERDAANVPRWATAFPYVNGGLFSGNTDVPLFSKIARSYLLHIGSLNWQKINPDIFGSMIQAVTDDEERGELGMHYTSVPNILKVLNPLFLDNLRSQLEEAGDNGRKLLNLRKRMSNIRVFDPACGSGNFLVIAYKEMRLIEAEINTRRNEGSAQTAIPLTNFRGIELRDFPAEIARLALIIAEYQCDVLYRGKRDALADFLPLNDMNWVTCGNALRLDWLSICPPTGTGVKLQAEDLFETPLDQAEIDFENEGGETYICGNPPYLGSKFQSKEQKEDLKRIFDGRSNNWKSLDYIAGWIMKAADYGTQTDAVSAFVSTNSINQGQQVPILWPLVFSTGHEIIFAHTSFKWANLASHNAGVTVVIVGISNHTTAERQLFSSDKFGELALKKVENLNAYLVPAMNVFINKASSSISNLPQMLSGDKMTDGGHLVFSPQQRRELITQHPNSERLLSRIVGGQELIKGVLRYALVVGEHERAFAKGIPDIDLRFNQVAKMRKKSSKKSTQVLAQFPHRFDETRFSRVPKLMIAQLSSETRNYFPCDMIGKDDVAMAPSLVIYDAPLWSMALIASRIHLVWIATVCGKLETRYRYSNTLGWNTFPVPTLTEKNKADLTTCAENILLAREAHFPATIADLYKPDAMPENLKAAHAHNDEVLERIYIGRRFKNDTERLEKLFDLYTKMTTKVAV